MYIYIYMFLLYVLIPVLKVLYVLYFLFTDSHISPNICERLRFVKGLIFIKNRIQYNCFTASTIIGNPVAWQYGRGHPMASIKALIKIF